jgi:GT2 family glycosyltransferase
MKLYTQSINAKEEYKKDEHIHISVIVLTYNRKNLLKICIDSLIKQKFPKKRYEIIIINDNSSDDTLKYLQEISKKYDLIKVITNKKNTGPGMGRNIGIKKSKYEIVAFIDDDCKADKNWLKNISKFFLYNNKENAITGKLLKYDNNTKSVAWEYKLNQAVKNMYYHDNLSHKKYIDILATGNCAIRKEIFKKVGYFWIRPYGEDRDMKYRMQKKGYKIVYCEDVIVKHNLDYSLLTLLLKNIKYGRHEYYMRKKWSKKYYTIKGKSYSSNSLPATNIKNLFTLIRLQGIKGILSYFTIILTHICSSIGFYYEKHINNKIFHRKIK